MSLIGIISKNFGQGKITITADKLSGYLTGHGKSSISLWRKILELSGNVQKNEPVSVALINNRNEDYVSKLYELSPISVDEINIETVASHDLEKYDLIFFADITSCSINLQLKLKNWVLSGGGLVIESPSIVGEIDLIQQLDSVTVSLTKSAYNKKLYWTEYGRKSNLFTDLALMHVITQIDSDDISGWDIYMSDVETLYSIENTPNQFEKLSGTYFSQFSALLSCNFKNGIVVLEEGLESFETSSLSSLSTSSSDGYFVPSSSSSKSSSSQIELWNLCGYLLAHWKLNDNANNNVINDSAHNILNIAYLYEGVNKKNTSALTTQGIINSAIFFNGTNQYARTNNTSFLRMNNNSKDEDFSIAFWFYANKSSFTNNILITKKDCWEIGIKNSGTILFFKKIDNNNNYIEFSAPINIAFFEEWYFIVINSYTDSGLKAVMKINNKNLSISTNNIGYSGVNTKTTQFLMATNNSQYSRLTLDNVMIFSKKLTELEMEALYNNGLGTENCKGIFYYTSSSSTESSLSSSSSKDSSSSSLQYSSSSSSSRGTSSSSSSRGTSSSSSGDSSSSSSSRGTSSSSSRGTSSSSSSRGTSSSSSRGTSSSSSSRGTSSSSSFGDSSSSSQEFSSLSSFSSPSSLGDSSSSSIPLGYEALVQNFNINWFRGVLPSPAYENITDPELLWNYNIIFENLGDTTKTCFRLTSVYKDYFGDNVYRIRIHAPFGAYKNTTIRITTIRGTYTGILPPPTNIDWPPYQEHLWTFYKNGIDSSNQIDWFKLTKAQNVRTSIFNVVNGDEIYFKDWNTSNTKFYYHPTSPWHVSVSGKRIGSELTDMDLATLIPP